MRSVVKRGLASVLGLATLGVLGVTTAAPAQAAVSDCPSGYFCAWKTDNTTGTMFKTSESKATLGEWNNAFRSVVNRTSQIACLYDKEDYVPAVEAGTDHVVGPDTTGGYLGFGTANTGSLKFVGTARECDGNAYPAWQAETAPEAAGFGDLDGDRKADVLVRDEAGRLWFLPGDRTGRMVGTGWNDADALTRHGDVSGDGREDVIAREKATGKLWLHPGTGTGDFGARVLIGTGGWNGMDRITAFGDLTADGRSDLLAVEKTTGKLWLYPSTPTGTLGTRVLLGTGGWNAMNALVGAGDMNGDGHPDLIAREASPAKLWLYPSTATGTLGARVLIGSGGWNRLGSFLAVGDFSGDGRADLAAISGGSYVIDGVPGKQGWLVTYQGLGTGALAAGRNVDPDWDDLNGAF
ncbi:FG-GAP-like repeat-containing protein [Streptomyces gardneri]|uniref:ATP/GTP-binding protein n=1 Tax=Streptomyces gardneri TaxID=66892 RepID=A0A4Y3RJT8_9ACTN|nr:FG-GAP-like repeat-containing protein [Streptomyces gardneri]GEB57639.1 ATP/GTP-binding protein [Streptomyces gardneri]